MLRRCAAATAVLLLAMACFASPDEAIELGELSDLTTVSDTRLDHEESGIKRLGREVREKQRRKRADKIRLGKKLLKDEEAKDGIRLLTAEANSEEARQEAKSRALEQKLEEHQKADQNIEDLKRVVSGHSENALSNFMQDSASRERMRKKLALQGNQEKARKQRALEQRWDPVRAGKRERDAKGAQNFLVKLRKENAQKSKWGLPKIPTKELKLDSPAEPQPEHVNRYEILSKKAFKDAASLSVRADDILKQNGLSRENNAGVGEQ